MFRRWPRGIFARGSIRLSGGDWQQFGDEWRWRVDPAAIDFPRLSRPARWRRLAAWQHSAAWKHSKEA
jgi:hypothetical protein